MSARFAVRGDVDGRGVEAEVDDADLRAVGVGGRGVGQDLRDDLGGQAAGGSDRGHGARLEGQRSVDDDRALVEGRTAGHDLVSGTRHRGPRGSP